MLQRLQNFSFRLSKYFRPDDQWHCGGLKNGEYCAAGPDNKGRCQIGNPCQPRLEDHTWQCTRSQQMGGDCKAGASPHGVCGQQRQACTPTRNLRRQRNRTALLVLVLVTTLVGLALLADRWQPMISAGPLSKHHAAFGETDCVSCHAIVEQPRSHWPTAVTTSANEELSGRCINCHQLGEHSQKPHSLSPALLSEPGITAKPARSESRQDGLPSLSLVQQAARLLRTDTQTDLACTVCHQEHRGSQAQLTNVSDQQCAVCHSNTFDSFSDHPNYQNYPAKRRTPIIFNHNTHFLKHFEEDEQTRYAPTGCLSCHKTNSVGRTMELTGFDAACASCHAAETNAENRASDKGIALLSIPALDLHTLRERGIDIGEWPNSSNAELAPISLHLVALLDEKLRNNIERLNTLDLYDLTDASEQDLQLVYQLAWRTKQLLFALQTGGTREISQWMKVEGSATTQNLWGLISPNLVDAAVQQAFPGLAIEVSRWLSSGMPRFQLNTAAADSPTRNEQPSTENSTAEADDAWLSNAVSSGDTEDGWLQQAPSDSDSLEEDNWLTENVGSTDVFDEDNWLEDAASDSHDRADDEPDNHAESIDDQPSAPPSLSLEDRANIGGWFLDGFYLRYRPSGHADGLIFSWVQHLLKHYPAQPDLMDTTLAQFISDDTPGNCFKCHSTDPASKSGQPFVVNWLGARSNPSVQGFTRFSHQAHFSMFTHHDSRQIGSGAEGCASCHILKRDADSSNNYQSRTQNSFQSDFSDLQHNDCASCHAQDQALHSCTVCHNYHIGEKGLGGISDKLTLP